MPAQNNRQYRLLLIHPNGSIQPERVYNTKAELDAAMSGVRRAVGIRYHCEEWTVSTATEECPDPVEEKMAEYDL